MKQGNFRKRLLISLSSLLAMLMVPAIAFAANTPTFNQTINAGTLSFNIFQSDDVTPVASPTVAFTAQNYAFACNSATGTLGDSNNKLNVTNLANGINTWTVAIAATGGPTATWSNGTQTYKYNDATGSGCTNGQMTVNPSVATLTDDCNSNCTANDATVSKGSSFTMDNSVPRNSITLFSDSAGTAWEGYLTGVSLTQKIPSLQHSGSYSLGMTITLTNT